MEERRLAEPAAAAAAHDYTMSPSAIIFAAATPAVARPAAATSAVARAVASVA